MQRISVLTREGAINQSSELKLINTLLYPTFTERLPVRGKTSGQFNTYSSFFEEKLCSQGHQNSFLTARF